MTKRISLIAITMILAGAGALAASGAAAQTPAAKEPLRVPRLTEAPKIDGVLDNPVWETQALKIEGFIQLSPKENGVPTEKTVAYLGYDEKNLYVAFRAYDSQPSRVRCSVTNRDGCLEDDWIFIMLDTFNEKRRAFSFLLNPIGVQMDMMRIEEGGNDNMDDSWDTVFFSDGKVDAEGYTVEAAIPFKSLRFPDVELKTWNIVLGRNLPRTGEIIMYPQYSRDIPGLDVKPSGTVFGLGYARAISDKFSIGANIKYAMQNLGSILFGYTLVLGTMGVYAVVLARRGRSLARRVPDEEKPWTGPPAPAPMPPKRRPLPPAAGAAGGRWPSSSGSSPP
ncbi:MAG: carbohydrate binding family 9 domain-containing protein, partial [Candidatus Aminicenantes bacterium]|nr:carbohydrate binding family 9 domain-containing protein [Candidatus Aminicenantes bacterium]